MAIAQRGSATSGAVSSNTWNVTKPTGVVADDYILVALTADFRANDPTPPTGFTQLATVQTQNVNQKTWLYGKKATGSEGATLTFTFDGVGGSAFGTYGCVAYSGVDTTTPMDVAAAAGTDGSSTTPAGLSQTTVTDGARVVALFGGRPGAGASGTVGGGATELVDIVGTVSNVFTYMEDFTKSPAGSVQLTFTSSAASAWNEFQVVLRPAASGNTYTKAGLAAIGP
jgi:hypothetical protein